MKPLSREASDALSALKSPEPTAADEARVRKNLERTLGMVIPVAGVAAGATAASAQAAQAATSASLSGTASGATALSLGAKVAGFVLAVGVGTTLTVAAARGVMTPRRAPAAEKVEKSVEKSLLAAKPPPQPAVAPETQPEVASVPQLQPEGAPVIAPEPTPETQVAPVTEPAIEVTVEDAARPPPAPSVKSAAVRPMVAQVEPPVAAGAGALTEEDEEEEAEDLAPPPPPPNTSESYDLKIETDFPNCDTETEMRSALNARRLLLVRRAEEAVGLLEAYQRRCPSGRWSNEAWAVRVGGLCMLGRRAEARGFLEWFSSESPERRAAVVSDLSKWCSADVLAQ